MNSNRLEKRRHTAPAVSLNEREMGDIALKVSYTKSRKNLNYQVQCSAPSDTFLMALRELGIKRILRA